MIATFGLLLLQSLSSGQIEAVRETTRHHFCNVYTDNLCFGLASGDRLVVDSRVDYTIYRISLATGAVVYLYRGFHPEREVSDHSPSGNKCLQYLPGQGVSCEYFWKNNGTSLNVYYKAAPDGAFSHIYFDLASSDSAEDVSGFLGNFRSCRRSESSIICTELRPFAGIGITKASGDKD